MKNKGSLSVIVILIAVLSAIAALSGIFSEWGSGTFMYESIRGRMVEIYGTGIYRHMSADVAIQGIAQDYITLTAGIPVLLISLLYARKGSFRGRLVIAGTLFYFLVTYLFYTAMGMYNELFLVYAALTGLSFFGLMITLLSFDIHVVKEHFRPDSPTGFAGGFLIFNSLAIGLMWLSVVVPPMISGEIYPDSLQHYTTLIVQGFDLGLLLPISFVLGIMLLQKKPLAYLCGTAYLVFLSLLMTALSAKIISMASHDVNVIPAIFIIPAINIATIIIALLTVRRTEQTF